MSSPTARSAGHREEGTASVELVAAIPFLLSAALVAAQLMLVGYAAWSAGVAARAGARAALVGRDAAEAARKALPAALREGARVDDADGVEVQVAIPRLLPPLPPLRVGAKSGLADG